MENIVLIDGNYWLFSAFHATAAMGNLMVNKDGIPTNAVFGFANRLENVLKNNPDYVVVAFDAKGKTFRNELMQEYKGTRKETPQELISQFALVREYLTAHHIPFCELEGYEGDDIIGTLATHASKQGYKVSIMTGDKDMMQLVNENVTVYKRNTKTKEDEAITPQSFYEKYGLQPDQMRDLLGLMGDSADNIPGIVGIGEKTALKLLKEYSTIENLKEHLDELKGKMGEKIRDNIEQGILSKQIATILKDVPIDLELENYRLKEFDENELVDFYKHYDMNSLLKKLTMKKSKTKNSEFKFEIVKKMPLIQSDVSLVSGVYNSNYHKSIVLGYAIYNQEMCYYISYEDALNDEEFKAYLNNENYHKFGYDIKRHQVASLWNGISIKGYSFDLQLAAYILNPSLKDEIKYVCDYLEYEDVMYDEEVFGKGAKRHIPESELLAKHLCLQAKAIYTLKDSVISKLKEDHQYELYEEVEIPVAKILAKMEFTGTKIDKKVLEKLELDFKERIENLEKTIHGLAGVEFNIASPKQLGEILFEKLQLPNGKKTKTGYSTAVDVLEKLKDVHPIINHILDYRMISKINSTYVKGLQEQIFIDDKIHTIYNQALTQTGRLSSIDPNLQNIPVRNEEGKMIRKAFIPSYDYLISFDYSQIELRVLAHLANVQSLISAFNENKDIHAHTATEIFDVSDDEVTSEMRRQAKAVNFGIIYGMSDFGLSEQIGVPVYQAKEFIQKYFMQYPEIKTYMDQQIEFCKSHGYVATILNRKRYIHEINEKNFMRQELGKRLAMNSPIQGSAADILKLAMIKVDRLMKENHMKSKMILQVHDELIFDVISDELEKMMEIVKTGMEEAIELKVSLKADGTYAKNWYDLK